MAGRIAGITIEIGGDTTKLQSALKGVDKTLKTTQANLKDINKLLKMDPGNVELLTQKQKNLKDAIKATKDRLKELKDAQSGVKQGTAEWDALQREIIATEQDLSKLKSEYRAFGSVAKQVVQEAGKKMQEFGQKISGVGQKFAPISKAAAGLVTGMGALGYKAVTAADDLNTLAKQTGLSTAEIQKMQYASDLIDVSFDDISGALKKMKPKMTDANESFKQLGVEIKNSDGSLRDAKDVFYDSIVALSKISNETERDQMAMELFGKSADSLAGVIDDGGAALKEFGDEAERLGMVMSQDELDALNAVNDQIDKMKANLKGAFLKVGLKIAEAAAPIVEKVAAGLEKLAGWLDKLTPEQMKLVMGVAAVVAVIGPALIIIGKIVTGIGMLVSGIGALLSPIGLIIAAIAAAIAIGVLLYKNWDKIKKFAKDLGKQIKKSFTDMKNNVTASVKNMKDNVVQSWNNMKTTVTTAMNNLKSTIQTAWTNLKTNVTTTVTNMKTAVVNTVNNLKTSVQNAINNLKTNVTNTVNNLKTTVTTAWENLKTTVVNTANNLKSSLESAWNNIKTSVTNAVDNLKNNVVNAWGNLKSSVENVVGNLHSSITNAWNNIKSSVTNAVGNLKSSAISAFNSVKDSAANIFDNLRNAITSKIEAAKTAISNTIQGIKNLFNFSWSLPHIKLPHFGIKGYTTILGAQIPQIGVDWYRKAYENPMMFKSPTVLATASGMKGFGDGHGAEIVLGLNKLRELVGTSSNVTINVYAQPGMDVNQLASKIQDRFVALQKQRSLAYA